jgi:hypothetical protein
MDGNMKVKWENGDRFEGTYKNGVKSDGTYTNFNGAVFTGSFDEEGKKKHGTQTNPDGSKYIGNYRDDKHWGQGEYILPNVFRYVGGFEDNLFHGEGIYYLPNGDQVKCQLNEGVIVGKSVYYFANGDRFEGSIARYEKGFNSEQVGKLYEKDGGFVREGRLINNVFEKSLDWDDLPDNEPIESNAGAGSDGLPARAAAEVMPELEPLVEAQEILPILRIALDYKSDPKSIELTRGSNTLVYSWKAVHASTGNIYIRRYMIDLYKIDYVYKIPNENRVVIGASVENIRGYEDNLTRDISNYSLGTQQNIDIYTRDGETEKVGLLLFQLVKNYNTNVKFE